MSDFDAFVVMNGFMFNHSSKMYRRASSPDMSGYASLFDVHMHILQAANGDVGYIHTPFLKYRINVGINTGRDPLADHRSAIELAERLGASPHAVASAYARACLEGALFSLRAGDHDDFRAPHRAQPMLRACFAGARMRCGATYSTGFVRRRGCRSPC